MVDDKNEVKKILAFFIGVLFFIFFMYVSFYLIAFIFALLSDHDQFAFHLKSILNDGDYVFDAVVIILASFYFIPLPILTYLNIKLSFYLSNKLIKEQ
ncbi:MAG: hypothetical protein AB7D29_05915 [Campylobacterales bacterium]